jgi:hypothetical protein
MRSTTAVRTRMRIAASAERVWDALMFYEQIDARPPLYLRILLPLPTGADARIAEVGGDVRCSYEGGGYLLKRLTRIEPPRHYGFDVVEQNITIGGGVELAGGCYALRALPNAATELTVTTRYIGARRPRWLWRAIEAAVCHGFHRFLLGSIRTRVDAVREFPSAAGERSSRGCLSLERDQLLGDASGASYQPPSRRQRENERE